MAMISCGECGTAISETARSCPVCGWVNPDNDPDVLAFRHAEASKLAADASDARILKFVVLPGAIVFVVALLICSGMVYRATHYDPSPLRKDHPSSRHQ